MAPARALPVAQQGQLVDTHARPSPLTAPRGPQYVTDDEFRASGHPLDVATRAYFEPRFGYDFSRVRVHTDRAAARSASALAAKAYTVGEDIVLNDGEHALERPSGRHLLAHELAHVVQQRRGGVAVPPTGDPYLEGAAQRAAEAIIRGTPVAVAGAAGISIACQPQTAPAPAPAGPVAVPSPPVPAPNPFDDPKARSSAAEAAKALVAYQKLPENERKRVVAVSYKRNLVHVLAALSATDQVKTFVDPLREIGRFVEETATRETAKMSDDQIAAEEAKFLVKQAVDAAQKAADAAAKAKGTTAAAPTQAEIQKARQDQVAATASYQPSATSWWGSLSLGDQASWTARGNAAIAAVVTYAAKKHPELALTAAQFKLDFPGIEAISGSAVAAGSPAIVGKVFVLSVELNPAYVMDVVVHEIFGHPEYGTYGTEYGLALYDKAAKQVPGYVPPDASTKAGQAARQTELSAYAYQETEIFAVLRSMAYRTAPTAADAPKVPNLDSQALVTWHVATLKKQWAPSLIVAILRGLRQRLAIDPRISKAALGVFDAAVLANFDAATRATVAK